MGDYIVTANKGNLGPVVYEINDAKTPIQAAFLAGVRYGFGVQIAGDDADSLESYARRENILVEEKRYHSGNQ